MSNKEIDLFVFNTGFTFLYSNTPSTRKLYNFLEGCWTISEIRLVNDVFKKIRKNI